MSEDPPRDSQTTKDDRARAVFGQSLASERFAVACNELAWRAREKRLLAFDAKENDCPHISSNYEQAAVDYERQLQDVIKRSVDAWRSG
jgi:hypothetical protein